MQINSAVGFGVLIVSRHTGQVTSHVSLYIHGAGRVTMTAICISRADCEELDVLLAGNYFWLPFSCTKVGQSLRSMLAREKRFNVR